MRAWIASVGIAAVAIHSVASSAGFRTFTDQPLHHAGLFFDRAALLLQGTSSLRRDRTASIERIADFRPDDRMRVMAASTALLAVEKREASGQVHGWRCTAVLVAQDTLLTNHHCINLDGKQFDTGEVWFNYLAPQTADVYPVGTVLESDKALDYAVLRVRLPHGHAAQRSLPLPSVRDAVPGERAIMVHHANADVQQISRAFCRVAVEQPFDKTQIRHSCPMASGASGSLLIAETDGAIIGLNHSVSRDPATLNGFATSMTAILAHSARLRAHLVTQ